MPATRANGPAGLQSEMTIRAPRVFQHRNYRIFFAGQFVSLTGTWLRSVAMGWLAYKLSNSPFMLGVVTFAAQSPMFFASPFVGVIADRFEKRRVFATTQALNMLQMAILTILTFTGLITIEILILLSLAGGIVQAVEAPARQSFTIEMVGREDLRQAISYNAMMFNMARTLGPAIGGILVAAFGEAWCFLINTISYAAVIGSLLAMKLERREPIKESDPWEDIKRGFVYVTHHAEIRTAIILSGTTGFFGMSFMALMPAYAGDVLHMGSEALGLTVSAFGLGALVGAAIAGRVGERYLFWLPTIAAAMVGTTLLFFANVTSLWLALMFIFPAGLSWLLMAVTNNSQIQLLAADEMRGRVMSFYAMGALGLQPLGALLLGYLADHFGVPFALTFGGLGCLAAAALSFSSLRRLKAKPRV